MVDIERGIMRAERVITSAAKALATLAPIIYAPEFVKAVELLREHKRIGICGLGKSGIIARKMSATLSSTGTPAYFLHAADALHGDMGMIHEDDALVLISHSGETEELVSLARSSITHKLPQVLITGDHRSTLAGICDVTLRTGVQGEAVGSAPTTSTTATLVLCDALALAVMRDDFTFDDFQARHPGGTLGAR